MENIEVSHGNINITNDSDPANKIIEVVPLLALAVRMELLGTDDPGMALEYIRAEFETPEDPYGAVMGKLARAQEEQDLEPDLTPYRMRSIEVLPVEHKAATKFDAEVKDFLRTELIGTINELRVEAHESLFPTPMTKGPM